MNDAAVPFILNTAVHAILDSPEGDRLATRLETVADVIGATVAGCGLNEHAEQYLWATLGDKIERLLDAADATVAACVEVQALERRLDLHVQTHVACARAASCETQRVLKRALSRAVSLRGRRFRALVDAS